jgi:hypothetical protein
MKAIVALRATARDVGLCASPNDCASSSRAPAGKHHQNPVTTHHATIDAEIDYLSHRFFLARTELPVGGLQ